MSYASTSHNSSSSRKLSALLLFFLHNASSILAQRTLVNNGRVDLETCINQESRYNIRLQYMGEADQIDERYVEAFEAAAKRWAKVIVGDLTDVQPPRGDINHDWFADTFAPRRFAEPVDDVVIGYDIPTTIDGRGGTLGSAGAVFVRRDRRGRPLQTISGIMLFDGSDLADMPTEDVKAVIQHEMGHVLGLVGTTTSRCTRACNTESPTQQASYVCPLASREYRQIAVGFRPVLELENNGGMGTACGHWEEDIFRTPTSSEVMTGFFEADLFQPLSAVTVAGLEDLGYEVDYCGADIWPATEDTIKRFEVYKTRQQMRMEGRMDRLNPQWEIDEETGNRFPWTTGEDDDSVDEGSTTSDSESTRIVGRYGLWLCAFVGAVAALI